jgi:hypothetical protein
LFILYINDLCNLNIDGKIVTYADDSCMLFSGPSWNEVYHKATKGLNSIYNCINERGLSLNVDKSMFMKFSVYKNTNIDSSLMIHNCNNLLICNNQGSELYALKNHEICAYVCSKKHQNMRYNMHLLFYKICV